MTPDREATADWRELARRIQKEEDPEKVFELVQQVQRRKATKGSYDYPEA